jgi:hypothetical protein
VLSVPGQPPIRQGARVDTEVGVRYLDIAATWNLLPEPLFLGPGIGVGTIAYDLDFKSRPARISIRDTQPFLYPLVRFAADAEVLEVEAGLGGISAEFGSTRVDYIEFDTNVSFSLFGGEAGPEGRVEIGYRYLMLDYEFREKGANVAIDATLSGPYLSFVLRF